MNLPKRKALRLQAYDYSAPGAYFVTFCTRDRAPVLGTVGKASHRLPQIELTELGKSTEAYIHRIPVVYPGVRLDAYVIMPNHVHQQHRAGGQGARPETGGHQPVSSVFLRSCDPQ